MHAYGAVVTMTPAAYHFAFAHSGEVAEWSNAPDSKSGLRFYRNVGSNPTLSARLPNTHCGSAMSLISVPVSYGELVDKLTILEIKSERMSDPSKLANVREELELLGATWSSDAASQTDISAERAELKRINAALWEIEDEIRLKEKAQMFDARFIELARAVYITNDQRAAVKRAINEKLGSRLIEEKSYQVYTRSDCELP